jgi:hypothetical protein
MFLLEGRAAGLGGDACSCWFLVLWLLNATYHSMAAIQQPKWLVACFF